MKRYLTTVFAIAAVLSSATALAQDGRGNDGWRNDGPRGNGSQQYRGDNDRNTHANGRGNGHDKHRDDDRGHGNGHDQRYRNDGYRPGHSNNYRPAYRPVYHPAPYVRAGYGYPAQPYAYRRGGYAPAVYLQPRYAIRDYRAYRLAPPPPNYYWVQPVDGRYLLIQATTGLIAQALGY